jgi:hypothetical protein
VVLHACCRQRQAEAAARRQLRLAEGLARAADGAEERLNRHAGKLRAANRAADARAAEARAAAEAARQVKRCLAWKP